MGSNPIGGTFFSSIRECTVHRFESYWSFYPEHDLKRLTRTVVERKHIGLIIQRTQDQNLAVRFIFLQSIGVFYIYVYIIQK